LPHEEYSLNVLVLLAHPAASSLNAAIATEICATLQTAGHSLWFHDLYREGFDPLLTAAELQDDFEPAGLLRTHCDQLKSADRIIVIHPNYRNQPPAILKGWVDRVVRAGVAFRYSGEPGQEGVLLGLLTTGAALVINTADCPESADRNKGFPLKTIWAKDVLGNCGVRQVEYCCFYDVLFSSPETRRAWLAKAGRLALELCKD
jgi:putative NADPH-quinone reductase